MNTILCSLPTSASSDRNANSSLRYHRIENQNHVGYLLGNRNTGNRKCEKEIQPAVTVSGADCGTDHDLLVSNIQVKFRKLKKVELPVKTEMENIQSDNKNDIMNTLCT